MIIAFKSGNKHFVKDQQVAQEMLNQMAKRLTTTGTKDYQTFTNEQGNVILIIKLSEVDYIDIENP